MTRIRRASQRLLRAVRTVVDGSRRVVAKHTRTVNRQWKRIQKFGRKIEWWHEFKVVFYTTAMLFATVYVAATINRLLGEGLINERIATGGAHPLMKSIEERIVRGEL